MATPPPRFAPPPRITPGANNGTDSTRPRRAPPATGTSPGPTGTAPGTPGTTASGISTPPPPFRPPPSSDKAPAPLPRSNPPPPFAPPREDKTSPSVPPAVARDSKPVGGGLSGGSSGRAAGRDLARSSIENGSDDVDSLKNKLKKAESDLKKADDLIVSQEDEIKRLSDEIEGLKIRRNSTDQSEAAPSPRNVPPASLSRAHGQQAAKATKDPPSKKSSAPSAAQTTRLTSSSGPAGKATLKHDELRKGAQRDAFSDLSIVLPSGSVTAHSCIITTRSGLLDKMLQDKYGNKKKIPKKKEIDIKFKDIASVNRVVDFLYSDDDTFVNRCTIAELFNISIAARKFGADRLLWVCENFFMTGITLSNVVPLLKAATEYKDERVKSFCVDFLLKPENFAAFVVRKDLTTELGMELFTEIVTMNTAAQVNGRPSSPTLGSQPSSTYAADMKTMYDNMQYVDASIKLEGETINFHKCIMVAASEKIHGAFTKAKFVAGQMDDVSECLLLSKDQKFHDQVSAEAFKGMLKYMYYGDTDIDPYAACQLIPLSRFYGLADLQELCERRMKDAVTNSKVVMKILGTTYLGMMAGREEMRSQLRGECIQHIVAHLREIDFSALKTMETDQALEAAMDIIAGCQKRS